MPYLQSANANSATSSVTSQAVAFAAPVQPGALLVVGVASRVTSGTTVAAVTDSQGNIYTKRAGLAATSLLGIEVWTATSPVGGPCTVTVTLAASARVNVCVHEYVLMQPSAVLDGTHGASGTGTAVDAGAVTTTYPTDLLFAFGAEEAGSETITPAAGWAVREQPTGSGTFRPWSADSIVATTGTYGAPFTLGSSQNWGCLLLALRRVLPTNAVKPFIFVVRAVQNAYYADAATGQPGFGGWTVPGDVIHENAVESPPIPADRWAYTFGSIERNPPVTGTFPAFPDLTGRTRAYWDCEYNDGAYDEAFAAAQFLRTNLDAWNTAHGTNIPLFAYFHTPLLDYVPPAGAAGDIATYVDGGTVGISQWQQVGQEQFVQMAGGASGGFTNGYVGLLKAKTRLRLGGIRLVIYSKDNPPVLLTRDQLLSQVQTAFLPVVQGGLNADIWESYYGNPISPTNWYDPMLGPLQFYRTNLGVIGASVGVVTPTGTIGESAAVAPSGVIAASVGVVTTSGTITGSSR